MPLIDSILNMSPFLLGHWGYWIVLISAILEASPLFGLLIPGQTIVIIGGFLAKMGIVDLGDIMVVSAIGAIIGDFIGYWLGRKYGYNFITRYGKYILFKKRYFDKTKKIMNHHTGKALIFGRFNPLTRAFAPFVAGSTSVPFFRFTAFNIIGGTLWAVSLSLLGYIFGKSYEAASIYAGRAILAVTAVSVIFIYLYRFINKRKHIFSRYHLYSLILNILSLYLFSKMAEDIMANESIIRLDQWLSINIIILHTDILNKVMVYITDIINPLEFSILSIILLGTLVYKKRWYNSFLLISGVFGGLLLDITIKHIIHRSRPENPLIDAAGYSFPSGHAVMAVIFFSLLIYSFKDDINNIILRYIFITGNISLFLLIGFSRIYLNLHWFSDVIAGFSLGLFWLTLLILSFKVFVSFYGKKLNRTKVLLENYMP